MDNLVKGYMAVIGIVFWISICSGESHMFMAASGIPVAGIMGRTLSSPTPTPRYTINILTSSVLHSSASKSICKYGVIQKNTKLYQTPDDNSRMFGSLLTKDTTIRIQDCNSVSSDDNSGSSKKWIKVEFNGYTGWIDTKAIEILDISIQSKIIPSPISTQTTNSTKKNTPASASNECFEWSHKLTGFYGNRYDIWTQKVRDTASGMPWEEFKEDVLKHNPQLRNDDFVFLKDKNYILPIECK